MILLPAWGVFRINLISSIKKLLTEENDFKKYKKGKKEIINTVWGEGGDVPHRVIKRQTAKREVERDCLNMWPQLYGLVIWNPLNLAAFSAAVSHLDVGGRSRR